MSEKLGLNVSPAAENTRGVKLAGILPGSLASRAGIPAGSILQAWIMHESKTDLINLGIHCDSRCDEHQKESDATNQKWKRQYVRRATGILAI